MCNTIEQCDHLLEFAPRQVLRDEDDPRALILVGPVGKPGQIVQQMLRALDYRWPTRFFLDVHQPLHPQQSRVEMLLKLRKQQMQRFARQGLVPDQVERRYAGVVPMRRVPFVTTLRLR